MKTEYSPAFQDAADMVYAHRSGGKWLENPHPEGSEGFQGWEDGLDYALSDDE